MRAKEKEKVLGREDLVGFCTSPVVAARATPVRQAPSQVDFTKSAKKSAKKIRPDLLQMLGTNRKVAEQNFPEFSSEFCPQFSRGFRASFRGDKKRSPKIPGVFQCKIPRQIRRKNPQSLLDSGQSKQFLRW